MALLQYDLRVVGIANVQRALSSMERMFAAHNGRVARQSRMASGAAAGARGRGPYRTAGGPAAAAAAGAMHGPGRQAFMRQQEMNHRRRMQHIRKEERARLTAGKRAARAEEMAMRRQARARTRFRQATMRDMGRRVRGSVGAVGRYGGLAVGMAGGFAMAGALQHHRKFDKDTRVLSIQAARAQGGEASDYMPLFRSRARALGARGEGAHAVMGGMRKYQALTGDPMGGLQLAERFTDLATSSGAEIEDVASTAGEAMLLLQQRGIKGAAALGQLDKILLNLTAQGAMGSIEFAEFAQVMGKVGASTAAFKDMPVADIVAMMSAFGQISKRGGAASGAEAATSMMRMADDMVKNASRFKKHGVDVFTYDQVDGKKIRGGIRNPLDVFGEVLESTGGDIAKIQDLFGIRGAKTAKSVMGMATNLGGGDMAKGIKLMRAEVARFQGATVSPEDVKRQAATVRKGDDMTIAAAMEQLNQDLGPEVARAMKQLIPAFQELTPLLADAATALADLVSWASENPYEGIGALIGALVAKDIAAAGIGAIIRRALAGALSGGGGGAAAAGGAGSSIVKGAAAGGGMGLLAKGGVAAMGIANIAGGYLGGSQRGSLGGSTSGKIGGALGAYTGALTGSGFIELAAMGGEAGIRSLAGGGGFMEEFGRVSDPMRYAPKKLTGGLAGGTMATAGGSIGAAGLATPETAKTLNIEGGEEMVAAAGSHKEAAAALVAAAAALQANAGKGGGPGVNRSNSPTAPRI